MFPNLFLRNTLQFLRHISLSKLNLFDKSKSLSTNYIIHFSSPKRQKNSVASPYNSVNSMGKDEL